MPFFNNTTVEVRYIDPKPCRRKFCGFMSLRGGCAIASAIWLGFNTYIATLSFLGYTPIFSYLNRPALITLGSLSIVFALVAVLLLYGLFKDTPYPLELGVIFLIFIVPIYLIDILVNIFIFGIQKTAYMKWCLESSKGIVDEVIQGVALNGTIFAIDPLPDMNIYNCQKLWEDELKFSIAILLVMSVCYIYWSMCVFYYYEKLRELFPRNNTAGMGGFMNYLYAPSRFFPMLPQYTY